MTVIPIAAITVFLLFALYLFLLYPSPGKRAARFHGVHFAHRGLHGNGITENTLPAFSLAAEKGYGIEFDVQLSSDGIPVVTHDYDLSRVFGRPEKVGALPAAELGRLGIPTLQEVLSVVNGRVPLLIEFKGENTDTGVCAASVLLLDAYKGQWCMESFNPFYVRWFRKNRPRVVRGQLASRFGKKNPAGNAALNLVLRLLLLNVLGRPDFIAFDFHYGNSFSPRFCRRLGASLFAWTLRSPADEEAVKARYDGYIFEGYLPE